MPSRSAEYKFCLVTDPADAVLAGRAALARLGASVGKGSKHRLVTFLDTPDNAYATANPRTLLRWRQKSEGAELIVKRTWSEPPLLADKIELDLLIGRDGVRTRYAAARPLPVDRVDGPLAARSPVDPAARSLADTWTRETKIEGALSLAGLPDLALVWVRWELPGGPIDELSFDGKDDDEWAAAAGVIRGALGDRLALATSKTQAWFAAFHPQQGG